MRRVLLQSAVFVRAARRLVKKNPEAAASLQATLVALAEDAFQPALKTHKLKGELAGSWACSAGYDLRIVFQFVQHEGFRGYPIANAGDARRGLLGRLWPKPLMAEPENAEKGFRSVFAARKTELARFSPSKPA